MEDNCLASLVSNDTFAAGVPSVALSTLAATVYRCTDVRVDFYKTCKGRRPRCFTTLALSCAPRRNVFMHGLVTNAFLSPAADLVLSRSETCMVRQVQHLKLVEMLER